MKADAALFSALLCILIAGTLTIAKTINEPGDQNRTNSSTTEGTTVTRVTSDGTPPPPTTHLTETPLVTTSKATTETPARTTATVASTTVTTTHRHNTSESPQTVTHLTTEKTTAKPPTTTAKPTTTTTTRTTTTKTTTTITTTTTSTTTRTPTTTSRTTTTTFAPTTVSSTTVTPNVVTNHNDNPTTEQTGGSEFPIWPQTTASPSTSRKPTMGSTTMKPTTSNSSTSSSSSHHTTTTTTTHHPTTTSKTTTTTFAPTPTLPPNPSPPAKWWNVVYDSNGTNCMMIRFAAQIDVTYVTMDNRTVATGFDIPSNASVNNDLSICDKASLSEVFVLNFASHSGADGYLVAIFKKNAKTNASSLFELMVSYPITKELFPGISPKFYDKIILLSSTNLTQFETDPLHCYACSSRLSLNFTSIKVQNAHGDDEPTPPPSSDPSTSEHIFKQSSFVTRDLKIQTFLPTKKNMDIFMTGKLCNGDKPDTLWTVDFIVAVVIAGLVALTLIIYYGVKKYKGRGAPPEDTLPIVEE